MKEQNSVLFGTVKFFNRSKQFGFIIPNDGGQDVHFHMNNCRRISGNENGGAKFTNRPYERWPNQGEQIVYILNRNKLKEKSCAAFLWGYQEFWTKDIGTRKEKESTVNTLAEIFDDGVSLSPPSTPTHQTSKENTEEIRRKQRDDEELIALANGTCGRNGKKAKQAFQEI